MIAVHFYANNYMKNFYTFSYMYKNYQLFMSTTINIHMYEIKLSKLPCDFNSTRIILQKTS